MSIFSEMKEKITPETWTKGSCGGQWEEGKSCMLGWKAVLLHGNPFSGYINDEYNPVLVNAIANLFPDRLISSGVEDTQAKIANFNDNKATTIHEVHAVLDEADKL